MPAFPGPPPDSQTMLVISVMGVPLYSARGLSQTLEPIDASKNMRRSINGVLTNVVHDQFQKYQSKITCTDMRAPAVDGIWPGMVVDVDCISYLGVFPGSSAVGRTIVEDSEFIEGDYTYYRPRLTMMVTAHTAQTDEYGGSVGWELDLEEV